MIYLNAIIMADISIYFIYFTINFIRKIVELHLILENKLRH